MLMDQGKWKDAVVKQWTTEFLEDFEQKLHKIMVIIIIRFCFVVLVLLLQNIQLITNYYYYHYQQHCITGALW